jgi:Family of unknown function (DUF5906)
VWLKMKGRRQALGGIVYEPGKPMIINDGVGLDTFNRWRPSGIEPKEGDVTPWLELLARTIPDEADRKWFEQWCAAPHVSPGLKMKMAVLLWGMQGTGKTSIGIALARTYGHDAGAINDKELIGDFNEWALDKRLICADELTGKDGEKKHKCADFLKGIIAGQEYLTIDGKFQRPFQIRNCINFFLTSNHPNALYLEESDRRFFVSEVPMWGTKEERAAFFAEFYKWLNNGGTEALLYRFLNHIDLTGFNPHAEAPLTQSKRDMIELSRSEVDSWLAENVGTVEDVVTVQGLATEYYADKGKEVSAKYITIGLKRLGAHMKPVKVRGKKMRLWSRDPDAKAWEPGKWSDEFLRSEKRRNVGEVVRFKREDDAINAPE